MFRNYLKQSALHGYRVPDRQLNCLLSTISIRNCQQPLKAQLSSSVNPAFIYPSGFTSYASRFYSSRGASETSETTRSTTVVEEERAKLRKIVQAKFQDHPQASELIMRIDNGEIHSRGQLNRFIHFGTLEQVEEARVLQFLEKQLSEEANNKKKLQGILLSMFSEDDLKRWTNVLELLQKVDKPSIPTPSKSVSSVDKDQKQSKCDEGEQLHSSLKSVQISDRFQTARLLPSMMNSPALLEKAKLETGGRVVTRFPPEPNGYLHLGHAKAMQLSFSVAEQEKGYTILRMDDTNPENEQQEYIDSIINSVHWLGYKPAKLTHASDYFPDMFDLACKLINEGKAYVDFQDQKTILEQREKMLESPYRDMSPETALRHFYDMRDGKYKEGEAVLRLKADMRHPLFVMRDMIAYRIKNTPHPRTGDTWKIYPTYDFTHCICDALEYITYSLCTLEFENRRESYYWLLQSLDLYRPHVWEFSRLNLSNMIVSKRKLQKLINQKIVRGWDDPRLITLEALKRRGYTPESIRSFCNAIGVTRNEQQISLKLLEHCVRVDLDEKAERRFAVLNPLKVIIENFSDAIAELRNASTNLLPQESLTQIHSVTENCIKLIVPNHPKDSSKGHRIVPLTRTLFIEQDDYRDVDLKKFFGLAPGKTVHLKYGFNIRFSHVSTDVNGEKTVHVVIDVRNSEKCKGNIHWLSQNEHGANPPSAEIRHYENLFLSESVPMDSEESILQDVNPNSELVIQNALLDWSFAGEKQEHFSKYQFERLGFYSIDTDSREGKPVFNRVVPLKESKERSNLKQS